MENSQGETALILASKNGHENIVKLLFQNSKVDVNVKDNHEKTALMYSVEYGHENVAKLLMQN